MQPGKAEERRIFIFNLGGYLDEKITEATGTRDAHQMDETGCCTKCGESWELGSCHAYKMWDKLVAHWHLKKVTYSSQLRFD